MSLAATSFYTFQRLVKGNAQQKSDVGAKEQPNITGKEAPSSDLGEETQAGHGANQLMTAFTQKTIMPKTAKSLLQPRLPTSFAQKVSPPSEPEGLEEFLYRPIHIPTL